MSVITGLAVLVLAFFIVQSIPDIQRYARLRDM